MGFLLFQVNTQACLSPWGIFSEVWEWGVVNMSACVKKIGIDNRKQLHPISLLSLNLLCFLLQHDCSFLFAVWSFSFSSVLFIFFLTVVVALPSYSASAPYFSSPCLSFLLDLDLTKNWQKYLFFLFFLSHHPLPSIVFFCSLASFPSFFVSIRQSKASVRLSGSIGEGWEKCSCVASITGLVYPSPDTAE